MNHYCQKCGRQRPTAKGWRRKKVTVAGGREVMINQQRLGCGHWYSVSQTEAA